MSFNEATTRARPEAGEVMDIDGALSRVMGDKELFCDIIDIFNDEYQNQLSDIRSAIDKGDAEALRGSAHTIKGTVASFCAKRAFELALKLEVMGRENDLSGVEEAFSDLKRAVEELRDALEIIKSSS